MATTDENTQSINALTARLNAIENNSKKISDLTLKTPVDVTDEIPIAGSKKITLQQIVDRALADYDLEGVIGYTVADLNESIRRTLTPYKLVTYLPVASPFTTPSITANTPTKILMATTVKSINGFGLVDLGGGNLAYSFLGGVTSTFAVNFGTGITAGTNNAVLKLELTLLTL